jgi:hypothetical protein
VFDAFSDGGTWLRCALHAHTTNSDGELPPDKLVRHYEWAGFDVLAITDHWVRTEAPSTDGLLVIPSSELSYAGPAERKHLLGLGIAENPFEFVRSGPDLATAAAWVAARNGVAYVAHPYWTGMGVDGLALPDTVAGIEIYNAGCELEVGRGLSTVHWDELLGHGRLCFGIAADDSHHGDRDSGYAWTWVRVPERSQEAVLGALRSGAFYSSSGPSIHDVSADADAVEVRCSPCRRVTLCAGPRRGSSANAGPSGYRHGAQILEESEDGSIVRARLDRPTHAPYGRLELVDERGRTAWTNPLWI